MIKVKGVESLNKKLQMLAEQQIEQVVGKAASIVEADAKLLCPTNKIWPSNAGQLRKSIHFKTESEGSTTKGIVYTANEYAMYVEFGTGRKGNGTYPYQIKGLNLEYADYNWRFENPDDPEEKIWTSGQVAQPYLYPALDKNKDKIKALFIADYNKLIKGMAK